MKATEIKFHDIQLTEFAASVAECLQAEPPEKAERSDSKLYLFLKENGLARIDKALFYCPLSIGAALIDTFPQEFDKVKSSAPLVIPYVTEYPAASAACYATMFTGTHNITHKISSERSKKIRTDTLFDSLSRSGKRCAAVTIKGLTAAKILKNTDATLFFEDCDAAAVTKAVELIKANDYDCVAVFNCDYDDAIHLSNPRSKTALRAMNAHIDSFALLADAAEVYWKDFNSFVAFCPDHGIYRAWYGLGSRNKYITEVMNIYHFFGIQPKTTE